MPSINRKRLLNDVSDLDAALTQTIVRNAPVQSDPASSDCRGVMSRAGRLEDLRALHQLSLQLLGIDDPDEVVRVSLDLLLHHTGASVVGFLWVSDDGELKPKQVVPENAAGEVNLSKSLTEVVCRKRRAIWIDNQSMSHQTSTLDHFADAICVPLVRDRTTFGALHLYLEQGRFAQHHFDLAIAWANTLVVALARARRQAILATNHSRLVARSADFDDLIGEGRLMQRLKNSIQRVARATGCVLIRGESGSGKELVARAIHQRSPRGDRPMLSVNCAAIRAT